MVQARSLQLFDIAYLSKHGNPWVFLFWTNPKFFESEVVGGHPSQVRSATSDPTTFKIYDKN